MRLPVAAVHWAAAVGAAVVEVVGLAVVVLEAEAEVGLGFDFGSDSDLGSDLGSGSGSDSDSGFDFVVRPQQLVVVVVELVEPVAAEPAELALVVAAGLVAELVVVLVAVVPAAAGPAVGLERVEHFGDFASAEDSCSAAEGCYYPEIVRSA